MRSAVSIAVRRFTVAVGPRREGAFLAYLRKILNQLRTAVQRADAGPLLAWAESERGDAAGARRRIVERLGADDLAEARRDVVWLLAIRLLAEALRDEGPLAEGRATEDGIRMTGLLARIAALAEPGPAASPEPGGQVFRREGEFWTIGYANRVIRLRDMRGLHYLETLLRQPGREFHASELVGACNGGLPPAPCRDGSLRVAIGLGDAGASLDGRACAAYRRRLSELAEQVTDAERRNDLGQLECARAEREALVAELEAAARGRRAASHAERARIAVTKAIKLALEKIAASHPPLGAHLAATIRRGYFCVPSSHLFGCREREPEHLRHGERGKKGRHYMSNFASRRLMGYMRVKTLPKIIYMVAMLVMVSFFSGQARAEANVCSETGCVCDPGDSCVTIPNNGDINIAGFNHLVTAAGKTSTKAVVVANGLREEALGHDIVVVPYREYNSPADGSAAAVLALNTKQVGCMVHQQNAFASLITDPCGAALSDPIVTVIGPLNSTTSMDMGPIFGANRFLFVSPQNLALSLTDPLTKPEYYARSIPNGLLQSLKAANLGFTTAATVHDNRTFGIELTNAFIANYTGSITVNTSIPSAATDAQIDAVLTTIASNPPQMIWMPMTPNDLAGRFVKLARGYPALANTVLAAGSNLQSDGLWQTANGCSPFPTCATQAGDGVLITGGNLSYEARSDYQDFLAAFIAAGGSPSGPSDANFAHLTDATTSDAYNIVIDAIEKVAVKVTPGSDKEDNAIFISRKRLRDELLNHTNVRYLTYKLNCSKPGSNEGDCNYQEDSIAIQEVVCTSASSCTFVQHP